ncbi:hypothetical protein ACLOAV_006990 [Pseudogymnoascus australis]
MATIKEEVSSIPSSAVPAKPKRKNSKAASQDGKKASNAISKNVSGSYLGTNEETNFAVASHVDKTAEQQQEQRATVEDRSNPLSTERHDNDNSASCNVIKGHLCDMYPTTFLPFQIQQAILQSLQRRLEHAAFEFYQKKHRFFSKN